MQSNKESKDTKMEAFMSLLWFGLLEAAMIVILGGIIFSHANAAQSGTFDTDRFLGVLPWMALTAIVAVLAGWGIWHNVKKMTKLRKKKRVVDSGQTEKPNP